MAQDDNEGDEYFEDAEEEDESSTNLKDGEITGDFFKYIYERK